MHFAHTTNGPTGPARVSIALIGTSPVVTVSESGAMATIRLEDMNARIEAAQALLAGTDLAIAYGPAAHTGVW